MRNFIRKLKKGKLVIPTTAYTGANASIGSIYATGGYLYWSNGTAWVSGAGGIV